MDIYTCVFLRAAWFAGVLMLLNTTNVPAGTPCNGAVFSGSSCEITNLVPTGSLMCVRFRSGNSV